MKATTIKELGTLKDFLESGLNRADDRDKMNFGNDCLYIGNDKSPFPGTDFKSKKEATEMFRNAKSELKTQYSG